MTDRYTKAIEQLGSDKLDIRLGGIYALERIARDSARDHPTVMEVLAAFIREHSRDVKTDETENEQPHSRKLRTDLQAALTVIGRRTLAHDTTSAKINLTRANLSGADLFGANLVNADLSGAYLTHADLSNANLTGAYLLGADLSGAYLFGAYLFGANLVGANLSAANLVGVNPVGVDFTAANLDGAIGLPKDVMHAYQEGVEFSGDGTGAREELPPEAAETKEEPGPPSSR
ncbi:pentapeptide repeat-containing protein [Streptosporangium sp. NPDC023615]|uniref:pentapeptide repeat-containing protein n=1 Tax=Streptosporangium sp. NPDC023615 TaxID=3154794 RepID=UPI003416DC11